MCVHVCAWGSWDAEAAQTEVEGITSGAWRTAAHHPRLSEPCPSSALPSSTNSKGPTKRGAGTRLASLIFTSPPPMPTQSYCGLPLPPQLHWVVRVITTSSRFDRSITEDRAARCLSSSSLYVGPVNSAFLLLKDSYR